MTQSPSSHVALSDAALRLSRSARSHYALVAPVRLLFLRWDRAKRRLAPALTPKNVDKVMSTPVTAIVAYDWPARPTPASGFR